MDYMDYPEWIYRQPKVSLKKWGLITKVEVFDVEYHKPLTRYVIGDRLVARAIDSLTQQMITRHKRQLDMYWSKTGVHFYRGG